MNLKSIALQVLNVLASLHLKQRGVSVTIGRDSGIFMWRISPNANAALRLGDQSLVSTNIVFERPNAAVEIGSRTFIGEASSTFWTIIMNHESISRRHCASGGGLVQAQVPHVNLARSSPSSVLHPRLLRPAFPLHRPANY